MPTVLDGLYFHTRSRQCHYASGKGQEENKFRLHDVLRFGKAGTKGLVKLLFIIPRTSEDIPFDKRQEGKEGSEAIYVKA